MRVPRVATASLLLVLVSSFVWIEWTGMNVIRQMRDSAKIAHWSLQLERSRERMKSDPVTLFSSSLAELPGKTARPIQDTVYVPAYSGIRILNGHTRVSLATTLSIHNTSEDTPIILERIDYHNTKGERVERYLEQPVALKPFGTIEVFVPRDDLRGGAGANFVIDWTSVTPVPEPAIETVMIGTVGAASYSFVSKGRSVRRVATN